MEQEQGGSSDRIAPPGRARDSTVSATTAQRKVGNIQTLRAVAALLVVSYHLTFVETKFGGRDPVLPSWFSEGTGGVDLFFVISGFVMVTVTRGKFHSGASARAFLFQRATRIYPLYWVYSLLVLAAFMANPSLVSSAQGNQVNLLSSFLLLPERSMPLLTVGWSLVFEFYFYLVFGAFLLLRDERHLPTALLAWAIAIAAGQAISYGLSIDYGPALAVMTHPMAYEFIVGCLIGVLIYADKTRFGATALVCGVAAFAVLCFSIDASMRSEVGDDRLKLTKDFLRVATFGIPASLIVYGAVSLEASRGMLFSRWMERIGDASYSIYLSHLLVMAALGRVWAATGWNGPVQTRLALLLIFAATIGFGFISYRWMELPLIDLARNWRWPKVPRANR